MDTTATDVPVRPLIPQQALVWLTLLQDVDTTWTAADLAKVSGMPEDLWTVYVHEFRRREWIQGCLPVEQICLTSTGIHVGRTVVKRLDCTHLRDIARSVGLDVHRALEGAA